MPDVTKSPLVLFLSAVLGAFTAGVGTFVFLGDQIDRRISSHVEAKPHETPPSATAVAAELEPAVLRIVSAEGGAVIPQGAVLAFDDGECPSGWSPYERGVGRMIVGVGPANGLTERHLRQTGGREVITLEVSQLPSHRHTMGVGTSDTTTMTPVQPRLVHLLSDQYNKSGVPSTGYDGEGMPIEIMPPWIALTLCRKD